MDGQELARRRQALGMSQRELGERLGVPQQTISRWEQGRHKIEHAPMLTLALDRLEAEREHPAGPMPSEPWDIQSSRRRPGARRSSDQGDRSTKRSADILEPGE